LANFVPHLPFRISLRGVTKFRSRSKLLLGVLSPQRACTGGNPMPRRQRRCSKRLLRCFVLYLLVSGVFAPPVDQPVPLHAPSPVSPIGFKTLTVATLVLVGLVAIMMMPSRAPVPNRDERQQLRAAAQLEVEQAWASFDPDSMTSLSLRPYEKAFAEVQKRDVGNFTELTRIEEQFKLPKHTLSKFLEWKKKLPAVLPSDSTKTKAEMMATKRAREVGEAAAAEKRTAEEAESNKAIAAEAIKKRYTESLDDMMLEACNHAILEAASSNSSLEDACKRVCVCARHSCLFNVFTPYRFLKNPSTISVTNSITLLAIVL
jgi:hypothetical protein